MSKMSTDPIRHTLNGATMGTRWSALFYAAAGFDPEPVQHALQAEMDEVDAQMTIWKPDSALMRLNAGPVGDWIEVPAVWQTYCARRLKSVVRPAGLSISAWAMRSAPGVLARMRPTGP